MFKTKKNILKFNSSFNSLKSLLRKHQTFKKHLKTWLSMFCLLNVYVFSYGQDTTAVRIDEPKQKADSTFYQYDISDLIRNIIHPKRKPDSLKKKSGITPMPNIAYNPSIGAQIGIKAVAGK